MQHCNHHSKFSNEVGYALLSLLLVIVAIFSAWLGMVLYQQARSFQHQDELMIETLHQVRLSALNHYQKQQTWPLLVLPEVIHRYVHGFEIRLHPAPHIRVQLASNAMLQRIEGKLAGSSVESDWLLLTLVTEPLGGWQVETDVNPDYLTRVNSLLGMDTHLSMSGHSLYDAAEFSAQNIAAAMANIEEGNFHELFTETASITAVSSAAAELNEMQAEQLEITSAIIERSRVKHIAVLEHAQVGSIETEMLNPNALTSELLASSVLKTKQMGVASLTAQTLHANEIYSQNLQAQQLQSGLIQADTVYNEQTYVERMHVQQTHLQDASVKETLADHLVVNQAVHLSVQSGAPIIQLQEELQLLFANLQHCMFTSRWCEAIHATAFSLHSCIGCNQQQADALFNAHIELRGDECVHGCDINLNLDNTSSAVWTCEPKAIDRLSALSTRCTISSILAENESWQQPVRIRAHNKKAPNVYSENTVFINWQRQPAYCPELTVSQFITGAEPANEELLIFPSTPLQEKAHVFVQRPDCNQNYPSELVCNGSATCRSDGEWQDINTSCTCVRTF
ncbi:hypothetical protein [Aliidiomarina sp.]|uniref:hypothetical protein n=1 Tax=Aliidiomarina sp. TaxID=1872439 RepID=UPI003A4DA0C8